MRFSLSIILLLSFSSLLAQQNDLILDYLKNDVSHQIIYRGTAGIFSPLADEAFSARSYELAFSYDKLNLTGDFDGDGLDEIALFQDLLYTPNMNPDYFAGVVRVRTSTGSAIRPLGTWYSVLKDELDFQHVNFCAAGDFTSDNKDDIAIMYNDPEADMVQVYLLESTGLDFKEAALWYETPRIEFNFTALAFASSGNFNGNTSADLAVLYNYFGDTPETKQAVFILESSGSSFDLLPVAYSTTKAEIDFSDIQFCQPGDFNADQISDIVLMYRDKSSNQIEFLVLEGSSTAGFSLSSYASLDSLMYPSAGVPAMLAGPFNEYGPDDLLVLRTNVETGKQEILSMYGTGSTFSSPEIVHKSISDSLSFVDLRTALTGTFYHEPDIRVATWYNNRAGAVSFTFDDGYRGAFEHGGAELEAAGLKGTFYVFTDTTALHYDGELASSALISKYVAMGHEIGSHSSNHVNLGYLTETENWDSLDYVLTESARVLEERYGQKPLCMSIPFGSFRPQTLEHIAKVYYSARSSQYDYNLSTPYDYFALKSRPILSSATPEFVDGLVATAQAWGYYLPLMYHDMTDQAFDEEEYIYNYDRGRFRETIDLLLQRDVWIGRHADVYKYMRERDALEVIPVDGPLDGSISFSSDDHLPDEIFDMELSLLVSLPADWEDGQVTIEQGDSLQVLEVSVLKGKAQCMLNHIPGSGIVKVHKGDITGLEEAVSPITPDGFYLQAAPNPFSDISRITVTGQAPPDAMLIVRDASGRICGNYPLNGRLEMEIRKGKLHPGLYLLRLESKDSVSPVLKCIIH